MITCEEYIREKPQIVWLHALDVLEWVLQARDPAKYTAYGNTNTNDSYLDDLRETLEKHVKPDGKYEEIVEQTLTNSEEYRPIVSDCGDINIERYVERNPLMFDDWKKEMEDEGKDAVTIVLDMGMPYEERDRPDMQYRHEKIYRIVMQCEDEGIPCRIIACQKLHYDAENITTVWHLIIKDYDEPLFPGLWGAFKTNATTNDFANCISDFLHGTHSGGNGCPLDYNVSETIDDDEVILVDPRRLTK